jgi:glucuronokinase
MGIAAGLQDRITQAHGTLMVMDFRDGQHVPVGARVPDDAFVAYCREAEESGVVHGRLRERWDAGDRALRDAVEQLRARAFEARDALLSGDRAQLGRAMTASTELRLGLYDPAAPHRGLFEAARGLGADANFTGSGGAVVCLPRDGAVDVAEHLRARGYGIARF